MTFETTFRPPLPYSLARSAFSPLDLTQRFSGGILELALDTAEGPARAKVWQNKDATLGAVIDAEHPEAAVDRLRFLLALDVDLAPFYAMVAGDRLLGPAVARARGLRSLRVGTAAHALLRGVTGQLVRTRDARAMEAAVLRRCARRHHTFWLAPTQAELLTVSVPHLEQAGLAARRAAALVRALRSIDLEALAELPTDAVVSRISAIPWLGPWTAGSVAIEGLGRLDAGMVADLGHVKLLTIELGRVPTHEESAELLDRFAPYQALASLYLHLVPGSRIPASPGVVARRS